MLATASLATASPRKDSHDPESAKQTVSSQATDGPNQYGNAAPVTPDSLRTGQAAQDSTVRANGTSRQPSPAPSSSSNLSSLSATPSLSRPGSVAASGEPPAKKRKLTPLEKEQQLKEKEQVRAQREAEKLAKIEERRHKNEEREEKKRQRELERGQKEQEKEEKRRAKEAEKQREEDEKLRKEKAQSRIMSFFVKPAANAPTTENAPTATRGQNSSSDRANDAGNFSEQASDATPAVQSLSLKSDYERTFLPFQVPQHGTSAPGTLFTWDQQATHFMEESFDKIQHLQDTTSKRPLKEIFDLSPQQTASKGIIGPSVQEVLQQLENALDSVSESHRSKRDATGRSHQMLCALPMKFLLFHEDVRPPYVGTFTKIRSRKEAARLARQPFKRAREDLDYDYDSEAEWEEPEEGEDLGSEGESDTDSEAADDLEDFLDDEEEGADGSRPRRKFLASEMEPVTSGICFEDRSGKCIPKTASSGLDLQDFRLELLWDNIAFPVDPFNYATTAEVEKATAATAAAAKLKAQTGPTIDALRIPLQARTTTSNNMQDQGNLAPTGKSGPKSSKPAKTNPKLLAGSELEQFKSMVEGSELPKVALLGILKSKFKKIPNEVLKDTLDTFAQRVGQKRDEKKWVTIEPAL